jgi:hypothetical protein
VCGDGSSARRRLVLPNLHYHHGKHTVIAVGILSVSQHQQVSMQSISIPLMRIVLTEYVS